MIIDVLSLFPEMLDSPLKASILGKAAERGLVRVRAHNIRDYARDRHQTTDDRPFGGGEGMVMKPEPLVEALEALGAEPPLPRSVLLTPRGSLFDQRKAEELSELPRLILVCGRYEGVDERVARYFVDEELSIGDYILSGGEPAALVVVDAVVRLLPGVLGNADSAARESFAEPLLEYPQYTRPRVFRGCEVPEALLSGHHERIRLWRRGMSLLRTRERRPDLFRQLKMTERDQDLLLRAMEEEGQA